MEFSLTVDATSPLSVCEWVGTRPGVSGIASCSNGLVDFFSLEAAQEKRARQRFKSF